MSLDPTRGFPLDLPEDGANAPYPLIPAGLFVVLLRGAYPLRPHGPTGPPPGGGGWRDDLVSISPWPAGHCPKGSFPPAGGNTEYGQLRVGRKRPVGVRWEQQAKVSSLPPPPEAIPRERARNRSAETNRDRTAQDKQGGGLELQTPGRSPLAVLRGPGAKPLGALCLLSAAAERRSAGRANAVKPSTAAIPQDGIPEMGHPKGHSPQKGSTFSIRHSAQTHNRVTASGGISESLPGEDVPAQTAPHSPQRIPHCWQSWSVPRWKSAQVHPPPG